MKQLNNKYKQQLLPLKLTNHVNPQFKVNPYQNSFSPVTLRKPLFSLHEKNSARSIKKQQHHSPPITQKNTLQIEKYGLDSNFEYILKFAVRTRQGMQIGNPNKQNQDSFIVFPNIGNKSYMHFFFICDGHGIHGHHISNFLKQQFPIYITKFKNQLENNPYATIYTIFAQVIKALDQSSIDQSYSGSTVVGLFMLHNKIYCPNLGDSRAVMLSRTNKWFLKNLSRDHKPDCQDEAERIVNQGGRIDPYKDQNGQACGPLRVWNNGNVPGLAMTRSIGDQVAKAVGVIDKPEIFNFILEKMDRVILLGSDGVFEFLSQQDILDSVTPYVDRMDVETACNHLLEMAHVSWVQKGNKVIDDITFILIFMQY
ncbi:unnamed protein product [Paramecium octaurelia]|uniref:PPM-type phosphatase domain-containing protein n=1 Tax=Paramecium octaurelia TaxID=43137 RepID=A0A8S1Y322_PAROT|nr:unnamed protein product [Paramecium octaurelia]